MSILLTTLLTFLTVNVFVLRWQLNKVRNALSELMDVLAKKFAHEMQVNQLQIDDLIEQTIRDIQREAD